MSSPSAKDIPLETIDFIASSTGISNRLEASSSTAIRRRRGTNAGFIHLKENASIYRDSISEVEFKLGVFISTFLYETLGFFVLPFVVLIEGRMGAENRGFLPKNVGFILQMSLFSTFLLINVFFFVFYDKVKNHFSLLQLILADGGVLIRNLVIATKWAYVSKESLKRLRSNKVDVVRDIQHRQVISGWLTIPDELIIRALHLSSVQRGVDLSKLKFTVDNGKNASRELKDALKILGENKIEFPTTSLMLSTDIPNEKSEEISKPTISPDTKFEDDTFPAHLLPIQLISSVNYKNRGMLLMLVYAFAALQGAIPVIVNLSSNRSFYSNIHWAGICLLLLNEFLCLFYYGTNMAFLLGGALDTYRRAYCMRNMRYLISTGYPYDALDRIHVDLAIPENIVSWVTVISPGFGFTYYIRIKIYTGYFIAILLAIIVYVYLQLLEGNGLDLVTVILFFYDLIWIAVPVFIMIIFGMMYNNETERHHEILLNERLSVLHQVSVTEMTKQERQSCKDAVDLLENSCSIIEMSGKRYSISILGFEAGSGLIKTAATVLATALFALIRFLSVGSL